MTTMQAHTPTFTALRTDTTLPVVDLSAAPLPTGRTLERRRSVPVQLARFAMFNLRIMRMVRSGHH
ncbi:hypothetical protein KDN32_01210 [Nocardioides sp. J2M5]|uniref:hypothetical protein n=1 Tax=Nocardioides palaemonis TaxID=2829810 RepID=UPI001BA8C867|nr:hypothetical protein [Nocardioides palaemonis]MBS2936357.1 hypothetical protein [Nocardioides palaemonis]